MATLRRELAMGLLLGGFLSAIGLVAAAALMRLLHANQSFGFQSAAVIPVTLIAVVVCGALTGSLLPLVFRRVGWDPALMSTPLVAMIIDIIGVLMYLELARWMVP